MYRFSIMKCQVFCMWDICLLNEPATCQLELPYLHYLVSWLLRTLPHQYHVLQVTAFTSQLMHNIPFLWFKFGWYEFQLTCQPWVSHSWCLIWAGPLWFFTLISHRWSDAANLLLYNFNVLTDWKVSITSRRKIRIKKLLEP